MNTFSAGRDKEAPGSKWDDRGKRKKTWEDKYSAEIWVIFKHLVENAQGVWLLGLLQVRIKQQSDF
jgi:hypothetical protein